jgi:uncharacterized membrane protein (DUF2068 family)
MATHVRVIASLYLAIGAMLLIGAFFTPLLLSFGAGMLAQSEEHGAQQSAAVLGFAGIVLSAFLFAFAIPFFVAAWGLLKFKPWARIFGIVLGVLCLIHIPFGTLLGLYAVIILFRKETEALFVPKTA